MKKYRDKNLLKAVKLTPNDYSITGDSKPLDREDGKVLLPYRFTPRFDVWKYYEA